MPIFFLAFLLSLIRIAFFFKEMLCFYFIKGTVMANSVKAVDQAKNKMKVLDLQELAEVSGGKTVEVDSWSTASNRCQTVQADEWSTASNDCR
ncbi:MULTISPECIES: hypothetical protein [unclassified Janthinobacterium]|uniref:hypothetical protein n=1 Tax=unclassified Janthinobacterium TaxID=2610881 RepID=UPI00161B706F|nr:MULTISPECIES: hypothetical protein [unclassified Janthinobacterium]MBB5368661.1 hypothetical protein [Janthinobacterium sp. K2C7]MBB5381803.1 hypothetical protein [Janthinobacterium sp. K2Li3]MBB5387043.1 hypothetical protein [Janthinobacterium sp. K2E3]